MKHHIQNIELQNTKQPLQVETFIEGVHEDYTTDDVLSIAKQIEFFSGMSTSRKIYNHVTLMDDNLLCFEDDKVQFVNKYGIKGKYSLVCKGDITTAFTDPDNVPHFYNFNDYLELYVNYNNDCGLFNITNCFVKFAKNKSNYLIIISPVVFELMENKL